MKREPIAYLRAVVEFPLYDGDVIDRPPNHWSDFIYEEPGITKDGGLGVCRRECKTINVEVREVAAQVNAEREGK